MTLNPFHCTGIYAIVTVQHFNLPLNKSEIFWTSVPAKIPRCGRSTNFSRTARKPKLNIHRTVRCALMITRKNQQHMAGRTRRRKESFAESTKMNLGRRRDREREIEREVERERAKKSKGKRDGEIIIALFAEAHCGGVGTTRDGQREARRKEHRQRPLNRATRV